MESEPKSSVYVRSLAQMTARAVRAEQKAAQLEQDVDALRELLRDAAKSIEFYYAKERNFEPVDEYDEMMFPVWARVDTALREKQ